MGKGTIISGGTDGQYQISVQYNVQRVQAEKTANLAKIADLSTRIAEETDDQKLNVLKLQKLSLEKRNEILDAVPESKEISAWCADLTEDLTGEVGLIEVPGESQYFNIQPGYDDNAVYNAARDGQLTPTLAMTPANAFYNLAMLPGWQKWKPTYRYGTITAISGDTADVTLDAATSTQQSLGVNQESTLTGVPVEYMSCNGGAFEVGDEVLVKFTGQDWAVPVIIGFRDEPKACGFQLKITRGDGKVLDESDGTYIYVYKSNMQYITGLSFLFDSETGYWSCTIPSDKISEDGLYFLEYGADYPAVETQYPFKYKTADKWQDENKVSQGKYEVNVPYFHSESVAVNDDGEVITGRMKVGEYSGNDDTYYEIQLTVRSSVPYFVNAYTEANSYSAAAWYWFDYYTGYPSGKMISDFASWQIGEGDKVASGDITSEFFNTSLVACALPANDVTVEKPANVSDITPTGESVHTIRFTNTSPSEYTITHSGSELTGDFRYIEGSNNWSMGLNADYE